MKKMNFGMLILILCAFEALLYLGMFAFTFFPQGKTFFLDNYNEMMKSGKVPDDFDQLFHQLQMIFLGASGVLIARFVVALIAYRKQIRILLMVLIGVQVMIIVVYFSIGTLPLVIYEAFILVSLMALNKKWLQIKFKENQGKAV